MKWNGLMDEIDGLVDGLMGFCNYNSKAKIKIKPLVRATTVIDLSTRKP